MDSDPVLFGIKLTIWEPEAMFLMNRIIVQITTPYVGTGVESIADASM
jgi:hypothetical protein